MTPSEVTELLLAVTWESYLAGDRLVIPTEHMRRLSCWDFWYVSYGIQESAPQLFAARFPARLRELRDGAGSANDVWRLIEEVPVGWPEPEVVYPGLLTWRQAQRQEAESGLALPAGAHCPVLVKPRVAVESVLAALEPVFQIEGCEARELGPKDVRRLYPTAYGAEFVGRVVDYLTSGPCTLLLVSAWQPIPSLDVCKALVRGQLGVMGNLENAIHLPASLGELYSNLTQFLGHAATREAYNEHNGTKHERRVALYRTLLGAGSSSRDVPE